MNNTFEFDINRSDNPGPLSFIYTLRTAINSITQKDTDNIVVSKSEVEDNILHVWFSDTDYRYEVKIDSYTGETLYKLKNKK